MIVSHHAAQRYVERVNPALSLAEARAAILASKRAVDAAAGFGCRIVRLGNGGKLILDGATVVTVLGHEQRAWAGHAGRCGL